MEPGRGRLKGEISREIQRQLTMTHTITMLPLIFIFSKN